MVIHWKWRVIPAYVLMLFAICLIVWVFLHMASKEMTVVDGERRENGAKEALPQGPAARLAVNTVYMKFHAPPSDSGNAQTETHYIRINLDSPLKIPNNTVLHAMSWKDLSLLYHKYLSQSQHICEDIARIGRVTDGGWDVCNDPKYKPQAPCMVYSFGIGDDFSFDDGIIRAYGCSVYSFDPSMKMTSQKRGDKSFFYQIGLADSDRTLPNGWNMYRLESIQASLKHVKKTIHAIKLDIEEWEWEVLPDLLAHDSLKTVTQLLIEFHQCDGCSNYDPLQDDKEPPRERYIHMLGLLRQLHELNFRIFHHHHNSACRYLSKFTYEQTSACSEIGFVRVL